MKVAVVGEVFSPNLGDGVIFECVSHLFAERGVEVVPIDLRGRRGWEPQGAAGSPAPAAGGARRVAQLAVRRSRALRRGITAWRWYSRERAHSAREWDAIIRSCDAVVIGGGQMLLDIGFSFAPRIAEIVRLARRQGKPVAFFGCGAGSRWGLVATRIYAGALNYASYVSVRDRASARMVARVLKPGREVVAHPDPGFAAGTVYPAGGGGAGVVGLGVQPAQHLRNFSPALESVDDATYLEFWATVARSVAAAGQEVEVFSNGDAEDQEAAARIHAHLVERGIRATLAPHPRTPAELVGLIAGYSAVLCTRMHAGIVSFALGRRTIPISWDPEKVRNVWDFLGRGEAVLDAEVLLHPDRWTLADPRGPRAAVLGAEERAEVRAELQREADACLDALRRA